jgi:hypothetical protein
MGPDGERVRLLLEILGATRSVTLAQAAVEAVPDRPKTMPCETAR